ncbi:hypothetical protein [Methylobacterium komagatae]
MGKLKPMYLYRLHLLSGAPRFYGPDDNVLRYLERRDLIRRTGRMDAGRSRVEYEITEAGRAAYEESTSRSG